MPRTKKFIDKKNSQTFYLSCAEPITFNEDESRNQYKDAEDETMSRSGEVDYEELEKFGIHYHDGYDYMQHLRTVRRDQEDGQAGGSRWIPKPASNTGKRGPTDNEADGNDRKRKSNADEQSAPVAPTSVNRPDDGGGVVRFRIERAAYDRSFKPTEVELADDVADLELLDEDIRAALDGGEDVEVDELDDDFVTLAGGPTASASSKPKRIRFQEDKHDDEFEINAPHQLADARRDRQLNKLLEMFDDRASGSEDDMSSGSDVDDVDAMEERFANGGGMKEQSKRGGQYDAMLSDSRFIRELERDVSRLVVGGGSKFGANYQDMFGDDDDDDTETGSDFGEKRKIRAERDQPVTIEPADDEVKERTKQLVSNPDAVSDSDESESEASDGEPEQEKWDCESILSLASNTFNRPTVIPRDTNTKRSRAGRSDSQSTTTSIATTTSIDTVTRAQIISARTHDETAEERKARKANVKAAQRERRAEKKQTKLAFRHEAVVQRDRGAAGAETNTIRL